MEGVVVAVVVLVGLVAVSAWVVACCRVRGREHNVKVVAELEPPMVTVANINTGGRFGNVFEFVMRDKEWVDKFNRMLATFEEQCPAELGYAAGTTWRALYTNADFDLALENKVTCRPNSLKTRGQWYAGDVAAFLKHWEALCLRRSLPEKGGVEIEAVTKTHLDLRAFDLFCQIAAAKAFSGEAEYLAFESRFTHVARSAADLRKKLELLLKPLVSEGVECVAIEEAFNAVDLDDRDEDKVRQGRGRVREIVELIVDICDHRYSALYRADTELAVLWRDGRIGAKQDDGAPKPPTIVELDKGQNCYTAKSGQQRVLLGADLRGGVADLYDAATAKVAAKAHASTRTKTLCLDLGGFAVFAIHAKEHKNCAGLLAQYFDALTLSVGRRPCVFLSDTNVEKPKDCSDFAKTLADYGFFDASRGACTTFKERTIFQGQPKKATIPQGGAATSQSQSGTVQGKHSFVFAPKDRIIAYNCEVRDIKLTPAPPTTANDDYTTGPRLPSQQWPSDHLAVLAKIVFLDDSVRNDPPAAYLAPTHTSHRDSFKPNQLADV